MLKGTHFKTRGWEVLGFILYAPITIANMYRAPHFKVANVKNSAVERYSAVSHSVGEHDKGKKNLPRAMEVSVSEQM